MEVLIVMVLIGLLATLVGPQLFKKVGKSKQRTAMAQISQLETALKIYRLDVGRYPTTEQGLKVLMEQPDGVRFWDGPYLEKNVPLDPWRNPYIYECPGERSEYEIITLGADGEIGGEGEDKDISSWEIT